MSIIKKKWKSKSRCVIELMIGEQNNGQVLVLVPSTSQNLLVSIKQTYQLYEFFDIISLEGVAAPKQKRVFIL